jgi:putative membrane protein
MMHWGNYGWDMGYGWIVMVLFWALIILAIAYMVRTFSRRAGQSGAEETPLSILKKRYAKGDITKEEFDRMKDNIMKH